MAIDADDFYRRYSPMVLRRCRHLLADEEQAADAMQDTFVQLLRYESRLDDSAPSSLLYRIATNVCLNRLRSQRRRPEKPETELLQRIADADEPESRLFARLRLGGLLSGVQTSTRTIAVLHHVDGLTLEEVAAEVGLSVSGVRKRLRKLRAHVSGLEAAGGAS
ncbi:MAG: sigma-70 family RNA polymerase sigma factor [Myxococcales bacterium]|nr:sigma-70 family RNA polymerase sigma factor [Myxococcales bacterium]